MNNLINNITEEYEAFLQRYLLEEKGKYILEDLLRINEERGVIFNLRGICDAMLDSITPYNWVEENDGSYTKTINNINPKNSFLKNITLNVTLVPKGREIDAGAEVILTKAAIDGKTQQMQGVVFGYTDYLRDDFTVNKINFYESMWHELQHAYRQYKLILGGVDDYTNLKHYNNALKYGENVGRYFNTKSFFYLSDKNEIDSHMHEMIPYLEQHSEINFDNFREYLENIPGYNIVKLLKFFSTNFYMVEQDDELRNELTRQCRQIFDDNKLTVRDCVYRTKKRTQNSVLYAEKQFYKVLSTTLNKLKRKGFYTEWHIRDRGRNKIIEEIKKTLEQ